MAKYKTTKDPLILFRNRVTEAGLLDGKSLDEIDKQCKQHIQQCVAHGQVLGSRRPRPIC